MKRVDVLTRHLTVQLCTSKEVHDDPFAEPAEEGVVSVYGISTSRVVKVLWAAAECGLKNIRRLELSPKDLAAQQWFMALNPKGTIPVLRDGPLVLNESNTIVAYLFQKYGQKLGNQMYPNMSAASLALAWQWLEYAESTIAEAQTPIFFPKVRKMAYPSGTSLRSDDEIKSLVPRLEKAIWGLEQHLHSSGGSYILGDCFTMADITAGVQVNRLFTNDGYGFRELKPNHFPATVEWMQRLLARPAFQAQVHGGVYAK